MRSARKWGPMAMFAGLAALVTGCGGEPAAGDNQTAVPVDANMLDAEPANDASAMEQVGNGYDPMPSPLPSENSGISSNDGAAEEPAPSPLGETEGGDTGGNGAGE